MRFNLTLEVRVFHAGTAYLKLHTEPQGGLPRENFFLGICFAGSESSDFNSAEMFWKLAWMNCNRAQGVVIGTERNTRPPHSLINNLGL